MSALLVRQLRDIATGLERALAIGPARLPSWETFRMIQASIRGEQAKLRRLIEGLREQTRMGDDR